MPYDRDMKGRQFIRKLRRAGVEIDTKRAKAGMCA